MAAVPMPLLAIVGPTGSGKSQIAVEVAVELQAQGVSAEIVSADAMQLYRGMDIGTAKITPAEARGIPHHLVDVWSPAEEASVQDYQHRAREVIGECFQRGVLPLLVGGSGLYVSSVVYQFDFPGTDSAIRTTLEQDLERKGLDSLVARLLDKDPGASETIDLKNPRRVIRALEIIQLTGNKQIPGLEARGRWWHEPTVLVGLEWPREELNRRIEQRVHRMWHSGLVAEVRALVESGPGLGKTATQAIGYRETLDFLSGEQSEEDTQSAIVQHTRRYARRQMSWFRRDQNIHWLNPESTPAVETIIRAIRAVWPGLSAG